MSRVENTGGTVSQGKASLSSRLLTIWPVLILSILYLLSPVISGGETYNLVIAGILIICSITAGLVSNSKLRKVARYTFIVGNVIGIAGVSPPLYFATFQGLVSPLELVLSITCIILTVIVVFKKSPALF